MQCTHAEFSRDKREGVFQPFLVLMIDISEDI